MKKLLTVLSSVCCSAILGAHATTAPVQFINDHSSDNAQDVGAPARTKQPGLQINKVNVPIPLFSRPDPTATVSFYIFATTLPNDSDLASFPIARSTVMNGFALHDGNPIETGSRSNNPAAVELKSYLEAGDAIVVSNPGSTTNYIWRGQLNPTNPYYAGKIGSRVYAPALLVANSGQVCLNGLSYTVIDGNGNFMDNSSSLSTNSYSVSRIGIITGPSGNLFGNDQTLLENGEAGTNMVNAIMFIGARAAVAVTGQTGVDQFNAYVSNGDTIRFIYTYSWMSNAVPVSQMAEKDVVLYQQSQIPTNRVGVEYFNTPQGLLVSLVNEPETNTFSVFSSSDLTTGIWNPVSYTATTGFSSVFLFTWNPTNDYAYFKYSQN